MVVFVSSPSFLASLPACERAARARRPSGRLWGLSLL